jgi:plastocyanin
MATDWTIHLKAPHSYDPASQQVKVGDTVLWVNDGGTHTVTPSAPDPDLPGSGTLNPGDKYPQNAPITIHGPPRTIKYYCKIHGAQLMSGELVVVP